MAGFAQSSSTSDKINTKINPSDHFVFQLTSDNWLQAPDSIGDRIKSNSRGANFYLMFDRPFKSDRRLSVAFGLGIGSSHIFFDRTSVDIAGNTSTLHFTNLDNQSRYKKYKVATTYLELPVELRFCSNPTLSAKAFKFALGARVGTLLNAHTKGKTLQDASGNTISSSIQKISTKSYFNSTRLMATARIGYGNYMLMGAYSLTPVFKDGVAADMRLLQIGFIFSGL